MHKEHRLNGFTGSQSSIDMSRQENNGHIIIFLLQVYSLQFSGRRVRFYRRHLLPLSCQPNWGHILSREVSSEQFKERTLKLVTLDSSARVSPQ